MRPRYPLLVVAPRPYPPPMSFVVAAERLVKEYASSLARAVDEISFKIGDGECFGFLGPNGAGKTTTMRMVSCRAQRTSGDLRVVDLDPARDERAIKSVIGVVPQENNLDSLLSVWENLIVYARYFGIPQPIAEERARELLDFVQLEDRAEWAVQALSGGMQRRLLIARALINLPKLMILDEPTTGLDPQARHLVWEKLRELKRRGVTLVITTHYMEEASQLCDRLVIMYQGRILVEGSPRELIEQHVAPVVVELTTGSLDALHALQERAAPLGVASEIAGDRLILHADDGEALLGEVNASGAKYEAAILRPASLEDVFLKLTGRRLEE
jgi:lipooligosaccharide transport system ATP-binding protein